MPARATVQANSVGKVLAAASERGIDAEALLRRVGISQADLEVPDNRVPFAALVALYEEAARLTGDETFGLRVGASTHPHMFDVLGHAVMTCSTLRGAFDTIERYLRVLQEGALVRLARG